MKLNKTLIIVLGLTSGVALAAIRPYYQDIKLPTQGMIEVQAVDDLAAASLSDILSANAGQTTTVTAVTVTSFLAQPDVPRSLRVTPGGTTSNVAACTIVVSGTNYFDASMSENFTFTNNQSQTVEGSKAFKTISSVVFPVDCEDVVAGATWSIGSGHKIGLKRCITNPGHVLYTTAVQLFESTRATVAASTTAVESNTADFDGSMNGANDFEIFFIQNFQCLP